MYSEKEREGYALVFLLKSKYMKRLGKKAMACLLAFLLIFQGGMGPSLLFAEDIPDPSGNQPPVLETIPDFVFSTDLPVEFQVNATDPDGDPLTFTIDELPPGAEFENGVFRWFPEEVHVGEYMPTITVSDGVHSVSQTILLYVVPGNLPTPDITDEILEDLSNSLTNNPPSTTGGNTGTGTGAGTPLGGLQSPNFVGNSIGTPTGTGGTTGGTTGGGVTGGVSVGNGIISQAPFFPSSTGTGTSGSGSTGGSTGGTTGGGTTGDGGTTTGAQSDFKFSDQTAASGVSALLNSESVAVGDLTSDGKIDLVVARPLGAYSLFTNNGNSTFRESTLLDLGNAFAGGVITLGDYNNDGFLDIFIARNGSDYLLRNNGNGTFQDVTAQAEVSSNANSVGAVFADYDKDGFIDLFVVNSGQPSVLFKNLANGTFSNVTQQAGIQIAVTDDNRAAAFFDMDNDGDLDLYLVNYLGANVLYVNQGNGTFAASQQAGVGDAGPGVGMTTGDFNLDGFMDFFVVNDSGVASPFYQNNGNGAFTNIASQVGIPSLGLNSRGAALVDLNNDGFLDLYIIRNSEQNMFLANDGAGKLVDKTTDSGTGLPLTARQLAVGDYNEDGLVDFFVAGNPFTVYRNDSPNTNTYIQIRTLGTQSNRGGLGARIDMTAGSRRQIHFVQDGTSSTKESPIQTLGLGTASSANTLTIMWPSGTVQDVKAKAGTNRLTGIRENAAPDLTVTGATSINEGQQLTLNLQTTDPDNSGAVQYDNFTLSVDSSPQNSTFADNGTGTGTFVFNPDFTQAGQYTLTFRVSDGDLTDTETRLITVGNVSTNRPPTLGALQNQTINEGQLLQFDVTGQDIDGDRLSFTISGPLPLPNNAGITADPNNPNLVHFAFSPDFTQSGVYDFVFTASDGSLSASAQARVTVNNVNRAPVIDLIGDKRVNEGQNLTFTVTGNDPDGDPITFSAIGLPTNGSFNPATKVFSFSPDFTQAGDYSIKFQASDGNLVTEQTIKITVDDVLRPGPHTPNLIDPGLANFSGIFTLRWSDESGSGATLYEVDESTTSDFQTLTRTFSTAANQQAVTVTTSGNYFHRVRALNGPLQSGGVASIYSNVVNLNVDLERNLDILKTFLNQGIIDGNPAQSQSNRQIVNDATGLGTLGSGNGNAILFNYDLKNQNLAGLFFENNGTPVNISNYKTVNLRMRGDAVAGMPVKLTIEMRKGGDFASFVLFFKITDQYQDFTFPFYQRLNEIDTMTILVEGDTQGDGLGTLYVDEYFLSTKPYLPNAKPNIAANSGAALSDDALLDKIEAQAAHYFYDQVLGPGYVKDADDKNFASIAATGFGLTALTVLANRFDSGNPNWNRVSYADAKQRAEAIMDDILRVQGLQAQDPSHYGAQGFLFHFVKNDGSRNGYSEVSSVDHALLLAGVLTAGEFFGGSLKTKADRIFMNTNWSAAVDANNMFIRSWTPEGGFTGVYDHYTDEILIMSLMAIATDPNNVSFLKSFYSFPRTENSYRGGTGEEFRLVNSFFGSLFTYLYAHCWFDFEKLGVDKPNLVPGAANPRSINWWGNSIQGVRSNRQFTLDRSQFFPFSYHSNSWGLSAVQRPDGYYEGQYGAPPFSLAAHDGTVAVYAPVSSMPFFRTIANEPLSDNQAFQVLKFYYTNHYNELFGAYGPRESFNNEGEFSQRYLGIDLGAEVIMMENYRTRFIWDTFKQNERIKAATDKIFGQPNGSDGFNVEVRNISDNQIAPNGLMDFGLAPAGTKFANGQQYLRIDYNISIANGALCIYTDNRNYTGQGEGAGLIGQTDRAEFVPVYWSAFDNTQAGGVPFTGNASSELVMQDRRRSDFLNPTVTQKRVAVDGSGTIMPAISNRGTDTTPIYIYFGADYTFSSSQEYKGVIVVEVSSIS